MRLVGAPRAKPPFGLKEWTEEANAFAVALGASSEDVASIARQIPAASSVAPGTLVVVLGEAAPGDGLFARFRGATKIARARRGSALLARGWVRVGGGVDPVSGSDLAWAWSS
jgi:hypothetical protein